MTQDARQTEGKGLARNQTRMSPGSPTIEIIECREFQKTAEINEVLTLMKLVHPHVECSLDLLRWQYFETPAGPSRIYAIKKHGKIVSMCFAGPVRIQSRNQIVPGWFLQDGMTHPEFRRQGYYRKLAEHFLEDLQDDSEVIYGFPNRFAQSCYLKIGWNILCLVPSRAKDLAGWTKSTDEIEVCKLTTEFDSIVSNIWMETEYSAAVVRDADYLNWRYRKPHQVYHRFLVESDKGVIVLKIFHNGKEPIVHICELFVRASNMMLLKPALQFCQQFAIECGAGFITAWLPPGHAYAETFEQEGFGLVDTDRNIFMSASGTNHDLILDRDTWYFSQGDSDVY